MLVVFLISLDEKGFYVMDSLKFEVGNKVVYPAHGVGGIIAIEDQVISGYEFTAYVVLFERDRMTLRIPMNKAKESGLRHVCSELDLKRVDKVLKSRPRTSRGMWSRRAKEYETKINSGNIVSLAEVVRDLHKNVDDPDRSYSERIIYENALDRLAGEISAIQEVEHAESLASLVKTIDDSVPVVILEETDNVAA